MKEIQEAIDALGKSPLFNLSLASKELFHSNFLAWVIAKNDERAKNLLLRLVPDLASSWISLKVEREMNNFDLTVIVKYSDNTKCWIVIENKVKSTPKSEQLDQYSSKLAKRSKKEGRAYPVLLSLTPPKFFNSEGKYRPTDDAEGQPEWRYYGYDSVLECLENGGSKDPYHAALLADYQNFVRNLIDLQAAIQDAFDSHPDALINPFNWPEKKEEPLYSQLKEIRMHDVFEKWRMIELQKQLQKMVRAEDREALNISTGFTNGLGLLDISPKGDHQCSFFKIQLQGTQLRQVLQKDNAHENEVFEQAKQLLNSSQWFRTAEGGQLPECGSENNQRFCKYGNGFVYRHEQLKDIFRLRDLVLQLSKQPFPADN